MPAARTDWTATTIAVVDDAQDREKASDGHSRYGAYLRQHADWFQDMRGADKHTAVREFAQAAWTIATGPVMSPGYIRIRSDLHSVTLTFSNDGENQLLVDVKVPLHHSDLTARRSLPARSRDWTTYRAADSGPYRAHCEPDATGPAVLTTTLVRLVVDDTWDLPAWQHTSGHGLVDDAKCAVAALAANINHRGGPVVAALRGER
ncbi:MULTISPECIES: hypothetical protein [Streptomyces]|uniref:hypothetical protein n=1 Tax=Streptomyces lycopersici TaxID=2974589 RepID=UPI0021D220D4|nr:hypothetical protein [Streptomyces sp. NEAU-383]